MNTTRSVFPGFRPLKWLVGGLMCVGLMVNAAPIFPLPNPAVHPPGFVMHLPPVGPTLLPPGGALPPLFFFDGLASPDLHHLELEINNPTPGPMAFNVTFGLPGGPLGGGLFLPGGASLFFDVMYPDLPEIGTWTITATSGPGMPGPVSLNADVLEYPGPMGAPGIGVVIPGGPPGAMFGPVLAGAPGIFLGITPVPEPGVAMLLGLGLLTLIRRR